MMNLFKDMSIFEGPKVERHCPLASNEASKTQIWRGLDKLVNVLPRHQGSDIADAAGNLNVAPLANCLSIGVLTTAPSRNLSRNCFAADHCQMHVLRHDTRQFLRNGLCAGICGEAEDYQ